MLSLTAARGSEEEEEENGNLSPAAEWKGGGKSNQKVRSGERERERRPQDCRKRPLMFLIPPS